MKSSQRRSPRDIPRTMLNAAHDMLREDGIGALKLRAIARRAGVSATAGDPHFGNLAGLLAELAADGFAALADALAGANADPMARGRSYIGFALAQPALFNLMFRSDALDWSRPRLSETAQRAFAFLGNTQGKAVSDQATALRAMAAWGIVHGLAALAIDGRMRALQTITGIESLEALTSQALALVRIGAADA